MKKVFLFALMATAPFLANAQSTNEDEEEFIKESYMVIDTAKVVAEAEAYKAKLRPRIDSLDARIEALKEILAHKDDKLSDELLAKYSTIVADMKVVYNESPDKFASRYKYFKDFTKIEKAMSKGKVLPEFQFALRYNMKEECQKEVDALRRKVNHDNFLLYREIEPREYPQKEVYRLKANPNSRANIFIEHRDRSTLTDAICEYDEKLLSLGWEWIKKGKHTNETESYPISYEYRKYAEHPEYKVLRRNYQPIVFDKEGNLVRVAWMSSRSNNDIWDIIHKNLLILEYRKDYEANKYNIKSEDSDVQYALRNRLGYTDEASNKMMTALARTMAQDVSSYDANTFKEYVTARRAAYKSAKGYVNEMLKLANVTAARFYSQLEKDHEDEYKYLYKIERLSDNSFKLHFVTYEMKPQYDVYVTYFGVAPFVCDYAIERVVKY